MEIALTVDCMDPFVKACYVLEGDGPVALTAYEHIFFIKSVTLF